MKEITNRTLSDLLDVAMTGCVSHRFNLAVKNYLKDYGITLQKTHELMKKLKNLKKALYLRRFTTLVPITRNKTRWSSTFNMLEGFFEIKSFNDRSDDDLYSLMTTANEEVVEKFLVDLADLDSITKELQRDGIALLVVRDLTNGAMETFLSLSSHISRGKCLPIKKLYNIWAKLARVVKIELHGKQRIQHFTMFNIHTFFACSWFFAFSFLEYFAEFFDVFPFPNSIGQSSSDIGGRNQRICLLATTSSIGVLKIKSYCKKIWYKISYLKSSKLEKVLAKISVLKGKLSDANIVHNEAFENAILVFLSGEKSNSSQDLLLATFWPNVEIPDDSDNEGAYFAQKILTKRKKTCEISCKWIPLTSNICERSFSVAKQIRWPQRNRLFLVHLERLMFPKLNPHYWDVKVVPGLKI